jgi:hypothetical protein
MAGDSAYANEGTIRITKGCGLTDEQVCKVLNLEAGLWAEHKARLADIGYIEVSEVNEITIVEWLRFQSDYNRTKDAPSRHTKSTNKSTRKSTGKKEKEKEKEKKLLVSPKGDTLSVAPTEFIELWNKTTRGSKISTKNKTLARQLRVRSGEPLFVAKWQDFVIAQGRVSWTVSWDWFLRNDANYLKAYDEIGTVQERKAQQPERDPILVEIDADRARVEAERKTE